MKKIGSGVGMSPRASLIRRTKRGGITLVIGAGVSLSRGVPDWETLAGRLWVEAFGKKRSPWQTPDAAHSPTRVPQFLPIIFELAYRKMGETRFLDALRKNLYSNVRYPGDDKGFKRSHESLAVLARLILQEHKRAGERRIDRIITLNCDDLVEQAVNAVAGLVRPRLAEQIAWPVARGTHSQWEGVHHQPPISLYHIHGFVPSNHTVRYKNYYGHMLVFTDVQYWSTSAAASSFANRVMASALSESRCVFVGLSMTDINLLRWLAMRTIERDRDFEVTKKAKGGELRAQKTFFDVVFQRHFWIRPPSDDPTGFVSEFLRLRGVQSVAIDSWAGRDFLELIEECFRAPIEREAD